MKKHAHLLVFVALASCAQLAPREDFDALQEAVDADAVLADVDAELGADVAADAQDGDAAADGEVDVKDVAVLDADGAEIVPDDADAGTDATDAGADTDSGVDAKLDVPPDVVVDACAGKNCDDSVPCTTDTCVPTTGCVHTPDASQCADGKPCTSDVCNPVSGCVNANISGACQDGNACTTGDTCQSGACVGVATTCDDGFACTVDACVPATGCTFTPDNSKCNDNNVCTTDSCNPVSGCVNANIAGGCNDGNTCTTGDACSSGVCKGVGVVCTAQDQCHDVGTCSGGVCSNPAKASGSGCSDGSACTTGDVCSSGTCAGTANCDDGNACTNDSCVSLVCQHVNNTAACSDGNACTTGDACVSGVCKGTLPVCGNGVCDCGETTASCLADCSAAPAGMVLIPAGTFWMGCNATKDTNCNSDENPQHKVTLSAYYMDLTETTVTQYKACVDAAVCTAPSTQSPSTYATYPGFPNNPVNYVSYTQSQAYCKWRGAAFDLPTEAQWEMAAKGSCEKNGSTAGDAGCAAAMRTYPWGEATATCSYAVMSNGTYGCGTGATWAVGSKTAGDSPYGLHDMAGNVWEWNRDWYSSTYYGSSPATDPYDSASASSRVLRGGSFYDAAVILRAGFRNYDSPSVASYDFGLRCMRSYP